MLKTVNWNDKNYKIQIFKNKQQINHFCLPIVFAII